jgi:serine/threonine protein kinase
MATTRDRWQKIEVLYHSALDRDPSARAAFLDGACGNDDELRREVESLLAETSTGQGLLDRPAEALLAESATIELKPGARLGPYQIEGLIGEGGMGTVYKARDTRLGRTVAIKTSSVRFSERFEREARAAAALNHPHICQLYDVGSDYLVMEYIEGENLKGPLPLDQTLKIAGQIADALEAAHEKGIVHCDLKPANVKIKPDGQVKVLDFGLASAGAEPELTPDSPTMMPGTQMGVILGTAGYMSHEQARRHLGLRRGALRDCHGKRLFDGATVSDSLAAILTKEPDLTMVPGKIRRLLQACLEKDSKNRLRDVADWARLLDVGHAFPTATMRKLPWIVSGVLALFLAGLGFVHFCQKPPETPILRYSIEPPEKTSFGPTPPALSPDGRKLVFSAQSADGKTQLWVRPLDSLTAQPLAGTDNGRAPFWSPDSKSIGFFANGKLMRAELA